MNSLTREQRVYGAAGASIVFIISLFLNWYGVGDFNLSGTDTVPSWWILLIFAAGAAAILIAGVVNFDLPSVIHPTAWPAYLTSVCFIVTLMIFLEGAGGGGRKFGLFIALLASLVAAVLSVMHWKEESK